jgi:biopolymer transport protein ExbD
MDSGMEKVVRVHLNPKPNPMAEINQSGVQKPDGKVRAKRQSTKIDMTPMVDLAFLLLTFFILTSTFTNFRIMDVQMPDRIDGGEPRPPVNVKDVLNLVLADNDKIYWWIGLDPPVKLTNYSNRGIRKILLERKDNPKLWVLIKPKDDSKYENMVDILDEIEIANIDRYAIVDFTEDDKTIIASGH